MKQLTVKSEQPAEVQPQQCQARAEKNEVLYSQRSFSNANNGSASPNPSYNISQFPRNVNICMINTRCLIKCLPVVSRVSSS